MRPSEMGGFEEINMRKVLIPSLIVLIGVFGIVLAQDYTPVSAEGTQTISGTKTYSGQLKVSGLSVAVPTATSLTNGAELTAAAELHVLTGTGQANNYTNTVTIANPTVVGQKLTLVVSGTSSNLIGLADSGNLKLTGAAVLDNYDSITLQATEAAVWVEISKTDN